jgi:hypothetical protein
MTNFFAVLFFIICFMTFSCKQPDKKMQAQEAKQNENFQSEIQENKKTNPETNYDTENYLLKDLGYISIPKSMEIQSGKYKEFSEDVQKNMSKIYKYEISDQRVVFQNIGVNEFDKGAIDDYTRVIIDTKIGSYGDYEKLTTNFNASEDEIKETNNQMKKSSEVNLKNSGSRLIKWYGIQILLVNGRTSLKTSFIRQLKENKPVLVTMYQFQNNDRMHSLTFSSQIEDTTKLKLAFMKILDSFEITNVR